MSIDSHLVAFPTRRNMQADTEILDVLTREGVLINVSVNYWRGGCKLKPEDLGLDPKKIDRRFFSLGRKRLLPEEAFAKLELTEGRAHSSVESMTFPFLNGKMRFLPNPRLSEAMRETQELQAEFAKHKAEFLAAYRARKATALAEWRAKAVELSIADVDRFVATIEVAFPDDVKLEDSFAFHVNLFQIGVPDTLSMDLTTFADQENLVKAREAAARAASQQIRAEVDTFVRDCVA